MVLCGASEMAGAEAAPTFALEEAVVRVSVDVQVYIRVDGRVHLYV